MAFTATLLFALMLAVAHGQNNTNKFWLLLDSVSVFKCQGASNNFELNKNNVVVNNKKGMECHVLEAPGTYEVAAKDIKLKEAVKNPSLQLSGVLQVALVKFGRIGSFDYPYSILPERTLTGNKCPKGSGAVQDGGKNYCRVCDACEAGKQADNKLNGKQDYFPKQGSNPDEPAFDDKTCHQFGKKVYTVKRTVKLPDENKMKEQYNDLSAKGTLQGQLKQKVDAGNGKIQMEIQVLSCDKAPQSKDQYYASSQRCKCCSTSGASGFMCRWMPCNTASCETEYSQTCSSSCRKVACVTVQFNYRVTDKPDEVRAFCKQKGYNQDLQEFEARQKSGSSPEPEDDD